MEVYNLTVIWLLYLSIIFLQPVVSVDEATFMQQFCSEEHYDQGSVFQRNLDLLLANLSNAAVTKKFYSSTMGKGVDKVYGLFFCNGAYTDQLCQDCVTVAAGQVQQKCAYDVEATVFYAQCMLRYSKRSIFSVLDVSVHTNFDYGSTSYKQFDQQLSSMFINLFKKANLDNSSLTFATEVVYVKETISLMSYVDCTPDLTPYDCNKCLQVGLSKLPMKGRQLGTTVLPSCRLSYLYIDVSPEKRSSMSYVALSAVAAVAGISFFINFYMLFRNRKSMEKLNGLEEFECMENLRIELSTIKVATDDFSSANKIGQGGFGVVYNFIWEHYQMDKL